MVVLTLCFAVIRDDSETLNSTVRNLMEEQVLVFWASSH